MRKTLIDSGSNEEKKGSLDLNWNDDLRYLADYCAEVDDDASSTD